ncbi:AGZA family xanthine/uracil permease-like MFS transporter [Chromobacterium alkanivorans]|uniref:NCS2 family permease n=1 Tax=Chromobacterium TaxID=535 RepID=UPI000652D452|nr:MULTISPECIES: NCS2 family permease [Chromobacterium]KMN81822.1 guanine permease [Chromobacterium sp. LK11]MBN3002721.1 NCS2 family permease [Chromobacterium alkanivorans]MCS3802600.1 AGZA family xanthine/uracil permease-like MFS transporter [Chromobacterium alkanivorans]MCS3816926.1 AGZA family xanthine/uracil permease-like MFS transporter [Chromobacterium alkanivorans]MCS3871966.1 AGZA family xanthine/uracil permease-like MFS transporter [Chromobacterium alkanivorans]
MQFLDSFFKLKEHGTTVKTEVIAGFTTFLTMAYIILVNPLILSSTGMDLNAVFVATCLAAALGTAIMGLVANYPIALAPGMGLNAYFTFSVVKGMGLSWETALGAVFISGIVFLAVSLFRVREAIVNAIPQSLKFAISAGVGMFLAIIALKNAGVIAPHPETYLTLGDIHKPTTLLAVLGFFLIVALEYRKVPGSIIIGILVVTVLSIAMGLSPFKGVVAPVPSMAPTFMKMDIAGALQAGLIGVIFVFFFVDLFDTTGTLVGVSHRAGLLKDGKLPRLKRALLADSVAITAGAVMGTSSTTAYVESAAGTAVGGRTGLTAMVVAVLFLASLWLSPLAATVPAYATAPALCYVAVLMARGLAEIDWSDLTESAPAVMTALAMPFTFSIADGIAFGFISYAVIKILAGRFSDLKLPVLVIAALWIFKLAFFH